MEKLFFILGTTIINNNNIKLTQISNTILWILLFYEKKLNSKANINLCLMLIQNVTLNFPLEKI